jgi:ankyrin repeat protein
MKSLEFNQMKSRKVTIKKNLEKTCQWLLIHPDYKAWLDPAKLAHHHGFLWISGKPGAGKSTIMKFAYLKMKSIRGNGKIASFFFNARGESLEKSTSGMYRSLLLQLFQGYSDLQTVLDDPEISPQNQEGCPPLNILKDLFRNAVAGLGQRQFTCFIDALDECDEQQVMDMVEFFEDLGELARDQSIPLRICFSSRHYPYIVLRRGLRLTLEDQSGHEVDLATYITRRLRINDPLLIEELQPELLKKAAGVFMWVVLVVQILNDEDRQGGLALRKRLAEIPSDLSKLFKDILTRDKENMDSLLLCIRWILFAERPLQPEEFRHALWSGLSLKDMADSQIPAAIHAEDGENLNKIVISSSKGLAEITKSTSPTVQFIHESVRDFLIRDNGLHELWPGLEIEWESSSHEELKQCCHFYLNHPDVSILVEDILLGAIFYEQEDIQNKYPFLKYAIQNILYHANSAAEVVVQNGFLSNFPITSWMNMNNYFEIHRVRRYNSAANMLYILSDKGYSHLVRTRLQEDPSRDQEVEERYHFPLFAALANGHTDTVAALLNSTSCIENGVDITEGLRNRNNLKGYKNRTPLTWAAQEGRLGILKRLLKTESHVDAEDKDGYTALLLAIKNGHETMANLLIDEGADVNASHGDLGRPLALASLHGFVEVAKLLIDKGAHVSENHDTPLSLAFLKGNEAMVRRLIDKGADVDSMSVGGMRVLHYASMKGHEAIVRLLIDKGAYVDSMNAEGMRALHYASMNGHEAIVRRLIDKGADVDSMGVGGREALHHASKHGHEAIVRLLIDLGAYVDSMDAERMRALHHASMIGHEAIVRILVDKGADVNSMGVGRMKALHYASMIGHEAIVRLLIDKGAYVDSMNAERMRALHHASKHGHEAIVRLLVDKGADVNSRDWERMRALHYASMNGHEAIVRRLIDLGADVNSGDFLGKTAFDHASQNGHLAVTRLLIQMNNLN